MNDHPVGSVALMLSFFIRSFIQRTFIELSLSWHLHGSTSITQGELFLICSRYIWWAPMSGQKSFKRVLDKSIDKVLASLLC